MKEEKIVTTQLTAKKFKLQSFLSKAMMVLSFIWFSIETQQPDPSVAIPVSLLMIALVWYIVNRVRTWWHHR